MMPIMNPLNEFANALAEELIKKNLIKTEISKLKIKLCERLKIKKIPTDIEIMLNVDEELLPKLSSLQTKPTRSISGVSVVAVMTAPHKCPHGKCIACPGGLDSFYGDVPQSYTGKEPATMRGIRNNYDPYMQVFNRLEQYVVLGHNFQKIELIIMGGTFLSTPIEYQDGFVLGCFKAFNDFGELFFVDGTLDIKKFKSFFELPCDIRNVERTKRIQDKIVALKKIEETTLEIEQKKNESAIVRCIALAIETRPDHCSDEHIKQMLKLGCTRVEIGVQSVYDDVLTKLERGHTVQDVFDATRRCKDSLLKVGYHIMPGLIGSSYERDVNMFKELFSDSDFKPDSLKIYPCMVMPGTRLHELFVEKKFVPISTAEAAQMIAEIKPIIPRYCRIMRVQRDIPTHATFAGVDRTNLRQIVFDLMKKENKRCNCIRCREPRKKKIDWDSVVMNIEEYGSSGGKEYFISLDEKKEDVLLGFLRLRISGQIAGIRELHIYGVAADIGKAGDIQHKGLGKRLMEKAEEIAKSHGADKLSVISGIGAKEYYKKLGYSYDGFYMSKYL